MKGAKILCLFTVLTASFFTGVHAQKLESKHFSHELSITNDNDFYLLQKKDGYYTNGLIIKLAVAGKSNNAAVIKTINQYEVGQLLFTQGQRKITDPALIDRPITGYLYSKYMRSNFLQTNHFWQWGASIGAIGKLGLGRNMQSFYHRQININSAHWEWVWDYQLKSEIGLNVHGSFGVPLIKSSSFLQVTPEVKATLGSIFTNLTPGLVVQVGKFNKASESSLWNSRVQNSNSTNNSKTELFFYYHPELVYQAYNATIQGGLFRKDKGRFTSAIEPFVMLQQAGVTYANRRLSATMQVAFQSKEAKSQKSNHKYGSLQLAYRFK